MILLHVTDLHFRKDWFNWLSDSAPQHDLLLLTGDLLDQAHPTYPSRQIDWVSRWVRDYPRPVSICSGNHDLVWDSREDAWTPAAWLRDLQDEKTWVDGQRAEVGDLAILNVAAFGQRHFEEAAIWAVHCAPPTLAVTSSQTGRDLGDPSMADPVTQFRPHLVFCGHVHEPQSWHDCYDGVTYLNPGSRTGARFPNHIIADFEQATLLHIVDHLVGPRCTPRFGLSLGARKTPLRDRSAASTVRFSAAEDVPAAVHSPSEFISSH